MSTVVNASNQYLVTDPQTSKKGLAAALVAFQAEAPVIAKNRTAKIPTKSGGSYSYKYADLADIWEAIRTPLGINGLAVTQEMVGGSNGHTGIKTTVWHTSGERISSTVEVDTKGRSPQEIGSQITYFKRYALAAALGLSTEEDDDGNAAQHAAPPAPSHKLEAAKDRLREAIAKSNADAAGFTWVKTATEADVPRILEIAQALEAAEPVVAK